MKEEKSGKAVVRTAASAGNLSEEERQGYATIEEIREGLFGFMPAVKRHMGFPAGPVGEGKRQP